MDVLAHSIWRTDSGHRVYLCYVKAEMYSTIVLMRIILRTETGKWFEIITTGDTWEDSMEPEDSD